MVLEPSDKSLGSWQVFFRGAWNHVNVCLLLPAPCVAQTEHIPTKATGAMWIHVKFSYDVALNQVSFLQCIATWTAQCFWSRSTDCYCLSRKYNSASQGKIHHPLSLACSKWTHTSSGSPLEKEPSGKPRQATVNLMLFPHGVRVQCECRTYLNKEGGRVE